MTTPAIIEVKEWAFSAKNRPISLYKSHPNPSHPILLIGGVHGDEPEGVWLAEATLQWLKSNTASAKTPWVLIPCLNPDGIANRERVNGNGVDLNRNYPSQSWSKQFEKPRYNPGPNPGSEPEIQSLVQLIQTLKPALVIHCHSWQPCVVYAGEPARKAAKALADESGYPLRDDIGYPTPGSLSQWGWQDNQIPVICIEECEGTQQKDVWPHFAKAIQKIFSSPESWSA